MKLDLSLFDEVGLSELPEDAKKSLLAHLYEQLELNVGGVISSELSDDQIDEFTALVNDKQDDKAAAWLAANYPNYKAVVAQELDKLKRELADNAPAILDSAA